MGKVETDRQAKAKTKKMFASNKRAFRKIAEDFDQS